jgi:hypothetical protein
VGLWGQGVRTVLHLAVTADKDHPDYRASTQAGTDTDGEPGTADAEDKEDPWAGEPDAVDAEDQASAGA